MTGQKIRGLAEIAGRFEAVLTDQYGVLHDGRAPFPGAVACLEALRDRGVPVVAVTNSGKRSAPNLTRLARLGFGPDLVPDLISSGEVVRARLEAMLAEGRLTEGAKVLLLARDGDRSLIDGLPVSTVTEGSPDLVLIAGVTPEVTSRADYAAHLAPLAQDGVPAICGNPDHVMYLGEGAAFGTGRVAQDYIEAGGPLEMVGKPSEAFFRLALSRLGAVDPARVLMIGDSPVHDIAGAARIGLQTLLIEGGIQADLDEGAGVSATYRADALTW